MVSSTRAMHCFCPDNSQKGEFQGFVEVKNFPREEALFRRDIQEVVAGMQYVKRSVVIV